MMAAEHCECTSCYLKTVRWKLLYYVDFISFKNAVLVEKKTIYLKGFLDFALIFNSVNR